MTIGALAAVALTATASSTLVATGASARRTGARPIELSNATPRCSSPWRSSRVR